VGTCASCDIMCDLSQCIGQFYTQECWCRKDLTVRLKKPLWWFREYDANFMTHESVYQFFCDGQCTGGICDAPGLQCKKREEACKPWWWCNLPPPKTDNLVPKDGWPEGFSYSSSMTLAQESMHTELRSGGQTRARRSDLRRGTLKQQALKRTNEQLQEATKAAVAESARLKAKAKTKGKAMAKDRDLPEFEANDFGNLNFKSGRFVCESGALPPKIQNPDSRIWGDRGYIVFDRQACKGSLFDHKCFCWDQVAYLRRQDPMTSEFKCDDSCSWGPCEGRKCGAAPPGPLPDDIPPAVLDAMAVEAMKQGELHNVDNKMDPA